MNNTVAAGAIVIHQLPGENTEALADRVLQKWREKAMAQSGDTLNFTFN